MSEPAASTAPLPDEGPPLAVGRARAGFAALAAASGLTLLSLADASPSGASWFGVEGPRCPIDGPYCPGCGLTRSTSLSLQGDFGTAVSVHASGPLVAALLVFGFLIATHAWLRGGPGNVHLRLARLGRSLFVIGLIVAVAWRTL